jgi:hypothetical protein
MHKRMDGADSTFTQKVQHVEKNLRFCFVQEKLSLFLRKTIERQATPTYVRTYSSINKKCGKK